ncbi:MAG: hypothetical protein J5594_00355 [Elusimicrobiaceae bacterium]|nr:hypothetical protein [Elusimicrobiaceae bacterium]
MKFKKLLFLALFFTPTFAMAISSFNGFRDNVTAENLPYFSKDLAGMLGASSYTTGRILGWGGFQLSMHGVWVPRLNKNNTALGPRDDNKNLFMPLIQGEIGLPFRLDGFIRAISYDGLTLAGGGLKWGITRPRDENYTFQAMIVTLAQSGVYRDFSVSHYSGDLVVSFKTPYVTPYIGAGVDYMVLTVESAADASLLDKKSYSTTARGTAGLNFKLPNYMDMSIAANFASYGVGYEANFGVRF